MHAEHNLPAEAGKRYGDQNSESTIQLSDLAEGLQTWADTHNWHEPDIITNRLKLRRAFAKPIAAAVAEFMSTGKIALALKIKAEFANLLEATRALDRMCIKRIDEDDEVVVFEHSKGQLNRKILDLAKLLDIKTMDDTDSLPQNTRSSHKIVVIPAANDGEWVTITEAAVLLGVSKSTVSKWAKKGRFDNNGLKRQKKRLSKVSVLLVKDEMNENELRQDIRELREDGKKYG